MTWRAMVRWGPVNPARAGMILNFALALIALECKPRASGDDPHFADYTNVWVE